MNRSPIIRKQRSTKNISAKINRISFVVQWALVVFAYFKSRLYFFFQENRESQFLSQKPIYAKKILPPNRPSVRSFFRSFVSAQLKYCVIFYLFTFFISLENTQIEHFPRKQTNKKIVFYFSNGKMDKNDENETNKTGINKNERKKIRTRMKCM